MPKECELDVKRYEGKDNFHVVVFAVYERFFLGCCMKLK